MTHDRITHDVAMDLLLSSPSVKVEFDAEAARYELLDRIVAARKARGWTQAELARHLGCKRPAISRLEAGTTDPRWSTLSAVLHALELPIAVDGRNLDRIAS